MGVFVWVQTQDYAL